jgi:hypothetical protein
MFAAHLPPAGKTFTPAEVAAARQSVGASLASLWDWLGKDASARLG